MSEKFRKKPVVIAATQWFKAGDHADVLPAPLDPITGFCPGFHGWIQTLEGGHIVTPGDWIITGVQGEHYPCKPDIFAATYEPANNTNAPTEWMTDDEDAPTLRTVIETVKQAHDECLDESYASSRAILRDVIADLEVLASHNEAAPPAPEAGLAIWECDALVADLHWAIEKTTPKQDEIRRVLRQTIEALAPAGTNTTEGA